MPPTFLNCAGLTPKGPYSLPKLPGFRERQYQPATSAPPEGQALSAKGQQPAYNQYAKTFTQIHNGVHIDSKGHL